MTDLYDMRVQQKENCIGSGSICSPLWQFDDYGFEIRQRRLKNIHDLRWKVDGLEKGRDRDMFF